MSLLWSVIPLLLLLWFMKPLAAMQPRGNVDVAIYNWANGLRGEAKAQRSAGKFQAQSPSKGGKKKKKVSTRSKSEDILPQMQKREGYQGISPRKVDKKKVRVSTRSKSEDSGRLRSEDKLPQMPQRGKPVHEDKIPVLKVSFPDIGNRFKYPDLLSAAKLHRSKKHVDAPRSVSSSSTVKDGIDWYSLQKEIKKHVNAPPSVSSSLLYPPTEDEIDWDLLQENILNYLKEHPEECRGIESTQFNSLGVSMRDHSIDDVNELNRRMIECLEEMTNSIDSALRKTF